MLNTSSPEAVVVSMAPSQRERKPRHVPGAARSGGPGASWSGRGDPDARPGAHPLFQGLQAGLQTRPLRPRPGDFIHEDPIPAAPTLLQGVDLKVQILA